MMSIRGEASRHAVDTSPSSPFVLIMLIVFVCVLVHGLALRYVPLLWFLYFGPLYVLSLLAFLWILCTSRRTSVTELGDYRALPFRTAYQRDMGLLTTYAATWNLLPGPSEINLSIERPTAILDIGSGDGTASVEHAERIFGSQVPLYLSDVHPNINAWEKLRNNRSHVRFIATSINSDTLNASKEPVLEEVQPLVLLVNSLHHIPDAKVHELLSVTRKMNSPVLIIDPTRSSPFLCLLIPNFFWTIYTVVSASGSCRSLYSRRPAYYLACLLFVPWVMCVDQIIGSTRRYSDDAIRQFGRGTGYDTHIRRHKGMNYIHMRPM